MRFALALILASHAAAGQDSLGATPLHDAVWAGRADLVAQLIARGADVNAKHSGAGSTPLDYAALRGETGIAEILLKAGALPDAAALRLAAARPSVAMLRLLLDAGADPNARDASGSCALDEAAFHGVPEVAAMLIDRGAQLDRANPRTGATPLNEAAGAGNSEVLALLLARGADASRPDHSGATPLANATAARRAEAVGILLSHDKSASAREAGLLDAAVLKGDLAMVRMLADRGADVNAKTPGGATPLHDAALKGYEQIAAVLMEHGAQVNARDGYGATPLHDAAMGGHTSLVQLLLDRGADVNARETESGATPIYSAAGMGRDDVVLLLLARGADPNIPNKAGHGALHAAVGNGFAATAESLKRHGAAEDRELARKTSTGR